MRTAAWLLMTIVVLQGPSISFAKTAQDDVKAAADGIYAAINSANVDGVVEYMAAGGYTEITATGHRVTIDEAYIRRILRPDFKANFTATEVEVRVFGEIALLTGYRVGGVLREGSELSREKFALSMLWVRQRGAWRILHVHLSPTTGEGSNP